MFINGHSKEELQSWDARVREGLGDHAEFQQSRRLREQIHSGMLNIQQSANVALPVNQHTEHHLAAQIVREREQKQRITGGSQMQKKQQTPIFFVVSMGWLVDEFVVG